MAPVWRLPPQVSAILRVVFLLAVVFAIRTAGAASYVYVLGGTTGVASPLSPVWVAPVQAGGTLGAWTSTVAPPINIREEWTVAMGNTIYSFTSNDASNNHHPDVYSSIAASNGTLSPWTSTTALPLALYQPVVVTDATCGYVYSIGGGSCCTGPGGTTNHVWSASVGGGTVGAWTTQSPFPTGLQEHAGCSMNGYAFVYMRGGSGSPNTWSAPISGGTVGTWTSQPAPGANVFGNQMVADPCGSYVYLVGGSPVSCWCPVSDVYVGNVTGGVISGWATTTPLPAGGFVEHLALIAAGYVFTIGGMDGTGSQVNAVYSAQVQAGGALGAWNSLAPLPASADAELHGCVVSFNTSGTPVACGCVPPVTVTPTPTQTLTPSLTGTPTATSIPGTLASTATLTPTCPLLAGSATPPFLYIDHNVFNPDYETVDITWAIEVPDEVAIQVYDSAGEFVRALDLQHCDGGLAYHATWDGKNYNGRTVATNVYTIVLRRLAVDFKKTITQRVVALRTQ